MTILRDIFEKPVDRPIEGVIKADDDASLRTELEEYVFRCLKLTFEWRLCWRIPKVAIHGAELLQQAISHSS